MDSGILPFMIPRRTLNYDIGGKNGEESVMEKFMNAKRAGSAEEFHEWVADINEEITDGQCATCTRLVDRIKRYYIYICTYKFCVI
jgi:hypothetical protein